MLIDLSRTPAPDIVERLDFEAIRAALLADYQARWPAYTAALESDPVVKLIEVAAYRELLLRARINDAAHAGLLASVAGADLDALAARYNTARLHDESDTALRRRTHLAYHQVAAAGSRERWIYHALSSSNAVQDADAWSDGPGRVAVAALVREMVAAQQADPDAAAIGAALFGAPPDGWAFRVAPASGAAFARLRGRLLSDTVAPLGCDVRIQAPDVATYSIDAVLVIPPGPDPVAVETAARARLGLRLAAWRAFRVDVHRAAVIEALLVDGVRNVELAQPAADIARGPGELGACTAVTLRVEVRRD
ncbi:MAG: baseplate J protein [Actinobacteria bacterium]|nr:baseplate J protein [Actinomycetota bacterium]